MFQEAIFMKYRNPQRWGRKSRDPAEVTVKLSRSAPSTDARDDKFINPLPLPVSARSHRNSATPPRVAPASTPPPADRHARAVFSSAPVSWRKQRVIRAR